MSNIIHPEKSSIVSMRNSPDETVRFRASLLTMVDVETWLESLIYRYDKPSLNRKRKPGYTLSFEIPEDEWTKEEPKFLFTIGIKDWIGIDRGALVRIFGEPADIKRGRATPTDYYTWQLDLTEWPLGVVLQLEINLLYRKYQREPLAAELVNHHFPKLFPHTSIDQVQLWFDNDLISIDNENTELPKLGEALLRGELSGMSNKPELPDLSILNT